MYRILIIEDDFRIAEGIRERLQQWDYEVQIIHDFRNIMHEFTQFSPHLVLLDITLPFYDGYHWCQEIRKVAKTPVIFISSATDRMNMIMAMNLGADDFIAKPFDLDILVAKIQALLRRTYDFNVENNLMEVRGAILNTDDQSLQFENEKISLSRNEFIILTVLFKNRGKTVSREKLMNALWQTDSFVDENTLSVNVNRLRKKLDQAGLADFIVTRFGIGYIVGEEK